MLKIYAAAGRPDAKGAHSLSYQNIYQPRVGPDLELRLADGSALFGVGIDKNIVVVSLKVVKTLHNIFYGHGCDGF